METGSGSLLLPNPDPSSVWQSTGLYGADSRAMSKDRLGSWTSSAPSLLVIGFMTVVGPVGELASWAVTGRMPQPWFAHLPLVYVPLAAWLLFKARREPALLRYLLTSLAASFLLMSLGPPWQALIPIWIVQRLVSTIAGVCMVAGAWPLATTLGRIIALATGCVTLPWPLLVGEPRRLVSFWILGALVYGVIASAGLRRQASTGQAAAEQCS
jgi:hypothetical protein